MELTELSQFLVAYYEKRLGYWPKESVWKETLKTIWYLHVNGFSDAEIHKELLKHKTDNISPIDLSNSLWNQQLTRKNVFYFHHALQIVSPAPVFSLSSGSSYNEDWCVPRIRFSQQDLNEYIWKQISPTERELWILGHDMERETNYLLTRFRDTLSEIEPLDYLLFLIDELIRDENKQHIKGIISVLNYMGNTLETYRNMIQTARVKGYNKPRWPSCF